MNIVGILGVFCFSISLLFTANCNGPTKKESTCSGTRNYKIASTILDENQKPTADVLQVLETLKIETDGSLKDVVEKTQKAWLRPANVERFNMQDLYADRREALVPIFKKLNLVDEVLPSQKHYTYALIHGGNIISTRARLSYLAKLWDSGLRFENLVILTGERDLDEKVESVTMIQKETVKQIRKQAQWILPIRSDWRYDSKIPFKTETDMMKIIYDQTELPSDFKKVPVTFINASKQTGKDGQIRRPNTADTIKKWLEMQPKTGGCLFISNQPFIGYQDSIVRTVMSDEFEIETVGFAMQPGYDSVSMTLDSLARWLFQENIRLNKSI